MISKEFENLLDAAGGRYIIVENGRPKYIIMNFEEYQEAFLDKKRLKSLTEKELVARINSDIALWRESRPKTEDALVEEIEDLEDIEYV